jgi:Spy/CpxP family protein refolding chaperone
MTPRAKTRLKIWLVVLGVFVLGCLTGVALDSALRLKGSAWERQGGRGPRGREDVFERMKRDLNLTDQQATDIRAILDQTRDEYRQLRQEVSPRYDAVRQQARARIRVLLNPEQQKVFDAKVAEHDARHNGEGKDDR